MIANSLKKLGLVECDILKSEGNKSCNVVINIRTGRLVALQPDDNFGAHKQLITAKWLQSHLTMIHRPGLYSRVIKTGNIKLGEIQKLITCINDKKEELIDRLISGSEIKPGHKLNEAIQACIKREGNPESASVVNDGNSSIVDIYNTIKAIDTDLADKILPFVKANVHHYMMLEDDFPHCDLEEKHHEYLNILLGQVTQIGPDSINQAINCTSLLSSLRDIWSQKDIADKWDQIKELPKASASPQDEQLQELTQAASLIEKIERQQAELLEIKEKIRTAQEEKQEKEKEKEKEIEESTRLLQALVPSEIRRPTCSISVHPQHREARACSKRHQTAYQQDKVRLHQALDQHRARATSGLPAGVASVVIPASVSSLPDGSVLLEWQDPPSKKAKLHPGTPSASVSQITGITDQDSLTQKLIEICDIEHDDWIVRQYDVCTYIEDPTHENKKRAIKAISRGFWRSSQINLCLQEAIKITQGNMEDNPFFHKYVQLTTADAFNSGILPWADENKQTPFFISVKNPAGQTYLVLGKGHLPSAAIKACREQLFIEEPYCFFQIIIYEVVLEALGEDVFNWYFSRNESRLLLTHKEATNHFYSVNPAEKLLMLMPDDTSKSKPSPGLIKVWNPGNAGHPKNNSTSVDKIGPLHGICTDNNKNQYTVPGVIRLTRALHPKLMLITRVPESPKYVPLTSISSENQVGLFLSEETTENLKETTYCLRWNEIMKIKVMYNESLKLTTRHDKYWLTH